MNNIDFAEIRAEIDQRMAPPMPIEDIARNARRRNRTQVAMSGVAVVAVLGLGVGVTQVLTHHETPPGPLAAAPYNRPFPVGTRALATTPVTKQISYALSQLPGDRGRLLWSTTTDGGQSWANRMMPAVGNWDAASKRYVLEPPVVLEESTVVVDSLISHDAGVTWAKRAPFGKPVSSLPAGWQITPPNTFSAEIAANSEQVRFGPTKTVKRMVAVIDPADGSLHKLTGTPATCSPSYSGQPQDGSLWLSCNAGAVVSHDRGASWQAFQVFPEDADKGTAFPDKVNAPLISVSSADGRVGFLISRPFDQDAKSTIYRTADGGASWQKVRTVNDKPPTTASRTRRCQRPIQRKVPRATHSGRTRRSTGRTPAARRM